MRLGLWSGSRLLILAMLCILLARAHEARAAAPQKAAARPSPAVALHPKGGVWLSDDQRKVVARYGSPPVFAIFISSVDDPKSDAMDRLEIWTYPERKTMVTFFNRALAGEEPVDIPELRGRKFTTTLRPEEFYAHLKFEDLCKLLGRRPVHSTKAPPDFAENAVSHDFGDNIVAVYGNEGPLVHVRVGPLAKKGGGK